MCRNWRRCLIHSPEARACNRAAVAFVKSIDELGKAFGEVTADVAGGTYSRWRLLLHKLLKGVTRAKEALVEKRRDLARVRAEHAARRLAELREAERRAAAERAVRDVEKAVVEHEAAEDALYEARAVELQTRPHEGWPSPQDVAFDVYLDAQSEELECQYQMQQAEKKLKAKDRQMDPATGAPTKAMEAYRRFQKRYAFSVRHSALMKLRYENTPTHDQALGDLAAAEKRIVEAAEALAEAKRIQDGLLAPGRPKKGTVPAPKRRGMAVIAA